MWLPTIFDLCVGVKIVRLHMKFVLVQETEVIQIFTNSHFFSKLIIKGNTRVIQGHYFVQPNHNRQTASC